MQGGPSTKRNIDFSYRVKTIVPQGVGRPPLYRIWVNEATKAGPDPTTALTVTTLRTGGITIIIMILTKIIRIYFVLRTLIPQVVWLIVS